jgi:hypothetical protein
MNAINQSAFSDYKPTDFARRFLYESGFLAGDQGNKSTERAAFSRSHNFWPNDAVKIIETLKRELTYGWDGYQGQPLNQSTVDFAITVLQRISNAETPRPAIVPVSDGSLQIEWHTNTCDIEIHVRAPNKVHAWRYVVGGDNDGEPIDLSSDFREIQPWIATLK